MLVVLTPNTVAASVTEYVIVLFAVKVSLKFLCLKIGGFIAFK